MILQKKSYQQLLGICFMAALIGLGSMWTRAGAQTQQCRDVVNIKVCADSFDDFLFTPPGFIARGNLRIGPKGAAAVIRVDNVGTNQAQFGFDPVADRLETAYIAGAVRFINDPSTVPLFSTKFKDNGSFMGVLQMNLNSAELSNPPFLIFPLLPADDPFVGVEFGFVDRALLTAFAKNNTIPKDHIYTALNLKNKTFTGTTQISLKFNQTQENPDVTISVATVFKDTGGNPTGKITGFNVRMAGLIVELNNIVFAIDSDNKPSFTAAKGKVLKATNPDLPGLTDGDVLFELTNLKYKEGEFAVTAAVPIPDWKFGEAFRLQNQTIGLSIDTATNTYLFTANSTLSFGSVVQYEGEQPTGSPTNIPVVVRVGGKVISGTFKPNIQAGLQNISPKIGPLLLGLKNVTLVGDVATNFYGLKADTVELRWPASLGGKTAAGIAGFKLGINKDKNLVFNMGAGTFGVPELNSKVLKGTFVGSVALQQNNVTFLLTGTLSVVIPGNSGVTSVANMTLRGGPNTGTGNACVDPCKKKFEMGLVGFGIKIAGFNLLLASVKGLEDGGFQAATVTLSLPPGLGNLTAAVSGFKIDGDGDVTVTGGQIELPPLAIAGVNLVGFKGGFLQNPDGGYTFSGGATITLPGLDPSGSQKISANATVTTRPLTGAFSGMDVIVSFNSTPGIPIGTTGTELTGFSGSFSLREGTATFGVGIKVASTFKIVTIPLVSLDGNATVQVTPFRMTLGAQLKVLVFQVAQASVEVGHQAGFNNGAGLHVNFTVDAAIVHGAVDLRLGKVNNQTRFAGTGTLGLGFEKNQFGFHIPPRDVDLASVSFSAGRFRDADTNVETAGLKGEISVLSIDFAVFVNLKKSIGQDGFVLVGPNARDQELITSRMARALAAKGVNGFKIRTMAEAELSALGVAPSKEPRAEFTIPYVITQTGTASFGIHYDMGAPIIQLQLPDGTTLTKASPQYSEDLQPVEKGGNDAEFVIKSVPLGTYKLIVSNVASTDEFTSGVNIFDAPPTLTQPTATCGGTPIEGVTVACGNTGGVSNATVTWTAADGDSPNAKVTVSYAAILTETGKLALETEHVLTEGLALGNGSYTWDLGEVPTGQYQLVVTVDDEANAPKIMAAATVVNITDKRAPKVPANLTSTPAAGQLLVRWDPNTEQDVAGYEIGFGVENDPAKFLYSRDMGAKEIVLSDNKGPDAKLWGLKDGETIYYGIRAYDHSGNYTNWSQLITGTPWALSPRAQTPLVNVISGTTGAPVEVAFISPLNPVANLNDVLVVTESLSQTVVAGTVSYLYDTDGVEIVGFRFEQTNPLKDKTTYNVTLKAGITTKDGRKMPSDYKWTFVVDGVSALPSQNSYLPIITH